LVERFPEIFELAFYAVWVPCTQIIGTESPAKMLVPVACNEAGTYLAVIPFPGTIFFAFLNFVLLTNALSSELRLGFASTISSSVGSALDGPDCWPLSEA
jgi:hypothetical protein